jgi:hypothetical protein
MNTQPSKTPYLLIALLLAFVALTSLACSFQPFTMKPITISPISPTFDITLPGDLFDRLSQRTYFHVGGSLENLLDRVNRVELHDGFIRFYGENDRLEGSFDLSLTAEDGAFKAEVIAVDIPGRELNDTVVARANQELEEAFTEMVEESNGEVVFQEVTIAEGGLRLKFQINTDEITIPEMEIEIN